MIDKSRFTYILLGDRHDLKEKVASLLVDFGFQHERLVFENGESMARAGDYQARLFERNGSHSLWLIRVTTDKGGIFGPIIKTFEIKQD